MKICVSRFKCFQHEVKYETNINKCVHILVHVRIEVNKTDVPCYMI